MTEIPSPYIPLSWLRQQRKWAKAFLQQGRPLDDYDLWLWVTRQEIDRLIILELHSVINLLEQENKLLHEKLFDEGYRPNYNE